MTLKFGIEKRFTKKSNTVDIKKYFTLFRIFHFLFFLDSDVFFLHVTFLTMTVVLGFNLLSPFRNGDVETNVS